MAPNFQDPVRRAALDEMIRCWRKGMFTAMTQEQVADICSTWMESNRPADGQNATDAQVASAVAAYLTAHPPAAGQNATDAQVAAAVAIYVAAHPPAAGANGKSAYELAVLGGFVGTQAAWLASLIGPAGTPKRIQEYSAVTNSSGIAIFAFSPVFAAISAIMVRPNWTASQYVGGGEIAGTRSVSGVQIQGMRSRGTLLLSAGPFEVCPAGVTLSITVFGS